MYVNCWDWIFVRDLWTFLIRCRIISVRNKNKDRFERRRAIKTFIKTLHSSWHQVWTGDEKLPVQNQWSQESTWMRTLRCFARLLGIDTTVGVFSSIWINLCDVVSLSLEKNDFCLRAILRLSFTTVASIGNGRRMQTEKAVWHDKRAWISITKILKMQPPSPIKRLISEKHLFCQNNEWLLIITKRYDMTFRFFEKAHVWLSAVFLWLAKDLEEPLKIFVYPRWSGNLFFSSALWT